MKTVMGITLAAMLALSIQPALAGDAIKGTIGVHSAWARATPPKAPAGGAFMTIANAGAQDDALVAAKAGVSKTVELHTHINDNGVMRMRAVPSIPVKAGEKVELAPGGLHVMLIGLEAPLEQGKSFPLVLVFEKAGEITVPVDIQAVGAMGGAPAMMHDPALHEQHMKDPDHRKMHEMMHGGK